MDTTLIIFIIGIMLLVGYLFNKLFDLIKLPTLIGTIFVGVLARILIVYVFKEVHFFEELLHSLHIVISIALGFEAFSIGTTIKTNKEKDKLRSNSNFYKLLILQIIFITLFTSVTYLIMKDMQFSLLIGGIVGAIIPINLIELVDRFKANNKIVSTLNNIVSFDNSAAILYFFVIFSICQPTVLNVENSLYSILGLLIAIAFGLLIGFILYLINKFAILKIKEENKESTYIFIIISVLLLSITGTLLLANTNVFQKFYISEFVVTFYAGILFGNLIDKKSDHIQHHAIHNFIAPLLTVFFVIVGMELDFTLLNGRLGIFLVAYILLTFIIKVFYSYFSLKKYKNDNKILHYAPFGIITRSSFVIYLAHLAKISINNNGLFLVIVISIFIFDTLEAYLLRKDTIFTIEELM